MKKPIVFWIIKLIAVAILVQTLYFKFTAAAESVYIFETLGIEPFGRIGSGIVELIASILILLPRTTLIGSLLGIATMLGAVFSHIFVLGIVVENDGGTLFILAVVTLVCCLFLAYAERSKIPRLKNYLMTNNVIEENNQNK